MPRKKTYKTILIDPPWYERGGGKIKRGADKHYPLMKTKQIPGVILESGVFNPNPKGCSIWLWATSNFLPDALWVLEQLGTKYVTNFVWVKGIQSTVMVGKGRKQTPKANILIVGQGLGQRSRQVHEHLLYARVGRVPIPTPPNRWLSVQAALRGGHSAKPDFQYDLIQAHDGRGSKLEMFARSTRKGWDSWGNEVSGK